jgi:hypothetical protein
MKKQDLARNPGDASSISARIKTGHGLKRALFLCAEEASSSGFSMTCLLLGAAMEAIDDDLSGLGLQTAPVTDVLN